MRYQIHDSTRRNSRDSAIVALLRLAVLALVLLPTAPAQDSPALTAPTMKALGIGDDIQVITTSIEGDPNTLFGRAARGGLADVLSVELSTTVADVVDNYGLVLGEIEGVALAFRMEGRWDAPLGIDWLALEGVTMVRAWKDDDSVVTGIGGLLHVADRTIHVAITVEQDENGDRSVGFVGIVDELRGGDVLTLASNAFPTASFASRLDDLLVLEDVTMVVESEGSFSLAARSTVMGSIESDTLLSFGKNDDGKTDLTIGHHIREFRFADCAPALHGSMLGDMVFPDVALVITTTNRDVDDDDMNPAEQQFFDAVLGSGDYELNLVPGLNFATSLSLQNLPNHILTAIGIDPDDRVILQGSPGVTFGLIPGAKPFDRDNLFLSAKLPPLSPAFAPAWFVEGQLELVLTGAPSVKLVGSVTVEISDPDQTKTDLITFFVGGSIEANVKGATISLMGGMETEQPWVAPLGIDWLTLERVLLKLSIDTTGSLGLGFAAEMAIGDTDIDVAAFLAINLATGVPTNIILNGASERGVALADLVAFQRRIAAARGKKGPKIDLGRLPDVAVQDLEFKFALFGDDDLGVEAGVALGGALLADVDLDGALDDIAEASFSIEADGIEAYGAVTGGKLGPVQWKNAELDLALTLQSQHFRMSGRARVGKIEKEVDIDLSMDSLLGGVFNKIGEKLAAVADAAKKAAEQARKAAELAKKKAEQARKKAEKAVTDFIKKVAKKKRSRRWRLW